MKKYLSLFLIFFLVFLYGCVRPNSEAGQSTNEPSTPLRSATPILLTTQPTQGFPPVSSPSPEVLATPVSGGGYPAPVIQALAVLAQQLNVSLEQIEVVDIVPKDWPDSCLGISEPGVMCAQMITPGFLVILSSANTRYEYHTDAKGTNLRLIHQPTLLIGGEKSRVLLEWTGPDCEMLSVTTQVLFYGTCGVSLKAYPNYSSSDEMVKNWSEIFSSFEANTQAGKIKLTGMGSTPSESNFTIPTPSEQRMMAEWARMQFDITQSRQTGLSDLGLVITYHREGGFVGFCDEVKVYLDGRVFISSCKGFTANIFLTATEIQQLYTWYDSLKTIVYSDSDPAVADGIKITLNMPGNGQKIADDATIKSIIVFVSDLSARAGFLAKAGPDMPSAREALTNYFTALHSGDYILGAKLYGGPTDLLQTWNPDIKNDLPTLLKRACQQNGLVCMLPRSNTYRGLDSRGGVQFLVEFNNPDGSLFVQGPCCGEPSGDQTGSNNVPGISTYLFSVLSVSGDWQVMDLPPYVP